MKARIVVAIVILIVVAALIANSFIGTSAGRTLDKAVRARIQDSDLEGKLTYSKLAVNQAKNGIVFRDIQYTDSATGIGITCERAGFDIPYNLALDIIRGEEIDTIESFSHTLRNLKINDENEGVEISVDELNLNFRGELPVVLFDEGDTPFPARRQRLDLVVEGMSFKSRKLEKDIQLPEDDLRRLSRIDRADLRLIFDPVAGELRCEKFNVKTPVSKGRLGGRLLFDGESMDGLTVTGLECDINSALTEGLDFVIPNGVGKYSVGASSFDLEMDLEWRLPGGKTKLRNLNGGFTMRDFKLTLDSDLADQLTDAIPADVRGLDLSEISIDEFTVNCKFDGEDLRVHHTKLETSLLEAALKCEVEIDSDHPDSSVIRSGVLTISHIRDELSGVVDLLESMSGQRFPRDRKGNLVFRFSGTLGKPQVEGMEL